MASGHLDHERARPLLYALQLASYNFRTLAQIQTAQARQPRTEDPMPHRVVRSRHGHTLAAPNDLSDHPALGKTAGCPVQAGPPASLLAGVEAPLGRDIEAGAPSKLCLGGIGAPKSPAPSPAGPSSGPTSAPPRRRKIARPEAVQLRHPAALPTTPATISPVPDDIPDYPAEGQPTSANPAPRPTPYK
jgi:hypothetical protein